MVLKMHLVRKPVTNYAFVLYLGRQTLKVAVALLVPFLFWTVLQGSYLDRKWSLFKVVPFYGPFFKSGTIFKKWYQKWYHLQKVVPKVVPLPFWTISGVPGPSGSGKCG